MRKESMERLDHTFFSQNAQAVAAQLIGCTLQTTFDGKKTSIKIVETEAYPPDDPASHVFRQKSPSARTQVQYLRAGHLYMYLIMGLHVMTSVVVDAENTPSVVFIRAGEPLEGLEVMRKRRNYHDSNLRRIASGPGLLTQALGLGLVHHGYDFFSPTSEVHFYAGQTQTVGTGMRINLGVHGVSEEEALLAVQQPWRYFLQGSKFLSK